MTNRLRRITESRGIRMLLFCISLFIACRLSDTTSSNGTTDSGTSAPGSTIVSPQTSIEDDLPVIEADLSIEGIQRNDDLLFFAHPSGLPAYGMETELFSADSRSHAYHCLTCALSSREDIGELVFIPEPALSPSGDMLAVNGFALTGEGNESAAGLWMIDLLAGDVRLYGKEDVQNYMLNNLAWSPDGSRIAGTVSGIINLIDARTGELLEPLHPSQLTPEQTTDESYFTASVGGYFSWSPSGQYLLYDEDLYHIVRIDVDRLSRAILRPNEPDHDYGSIFTFPAWSPNGDRILFVSDVANRPMGITWKQLFSGEEIVTGGELPIIAMDLYVMPADGSAEMCLTCEQDRSLAWAYTPTWSPDGKSISFFGYDFSQLPEVFENLSVVDTESGELRVLARFPNRQLQVFGGVQRISGPPRWSRDGQRLAFSAINEDNYAIYVIDADGSDMQMIAYEEGRNFLSPLWLGDQ